MELSYFSGGTEDKVDEILKLLQVEVNDIRMLVIHGVSGVGKTTLAKMVFNRISDHFDGCSFLVNFPETIRGRNDGFQILQTKLISDILKRDSEKIASVDKGISVIEETCSDIKVLIVLDEVQQHEKLIPKLDSFGPGSRIILTNRYNYVVPKTAITYEVKSMPQWEALRLFMKHAFPNQPFLSEHRLAEKITAVIGGLPLVIEVIASFLFDKKRGVWEHTLRMLQETKEVHEKLMICYEALNQEQKECLLDIALFLDGEDVRVASHVWRETPYELIESLRLLSLVKIDDNHAIWMHDELKDLGWKRLFHGGQLEYRTIVENWHDERKLVSFSTVKGVKKVAAVRLVSKDQETYRDAHFRQMPSLKFLHLKRANLEGDFQDAFPELKWLHWEGCPQVFYATNFLLNNLVVLILSRSKVMSTWEGWRHIKMARKLKVLTLSDCDDLIVTPNFSGYPGLERMTFERCSNLVKIDPSIRYLTKLTFLSLKYCKELHALPKELKYLTDLKEIHVDGTSLKDIPTSVGQMKMLRTLSASNCSALTRIPRSVGSLESLLELSLDNSKVTELPNSIFVLLKLRKLSLRNCRWLGEIPSSIGSLGESLLEMDVSGTGISNFPSSLSNLRRLKVLKMESSFIREIPSTIGGLTDLEELLASHSQALEGAIPDNIIELKSVRILRLAYTCISALPLRLCALPHLEVLDLVGCEMLKILPDLPPSLTILHYSCNGIKVPDLQKANGLTELYLADTYFEELTDQNTTVSSSEKLEFLQINLGMEKLGNLSLPALKILDLHLPQISCLHFVDRFSFHFIRKMVISCPNIRNVLLVCPTLVSLSVQHCWSLDLLNVTEMRALSELQLQDSAVHEIYGLRDLNALKILGISNCELKNLEGLERLTSLQSLTLSCCDKLSGIVLQDLEKLHELSVLNIQSCKKISMSGKMESKVKASGMKRFLEQKPVTATKIAKLELHSDIFGCSSGCGSDSEGKSEVEQEME